MTVDLPRIVREWSSCRSTVNEVDQRTDHVHAARPGLGATIRAVMVPNDGAAVDIVIKLSAASLVLQQVKQHEALSLPE